MNHVFDYPNIFFKIKLVAAAAPITTRGPLFATKSHTLSLISRIPDSFKGSSADQSTYDSLKTGKSKHIKSVKYVISFLCYSLSERFEK